MLKTVYSRSGIQAKYRFCPNRSGRVKQNNVNSYCLLFAPDKETCHKTNDIHAFVTKRFSAEPSTAAAESDQAGVDETTFLKILKSLSG